MGMSAVGVDVRPRLLLAGLLVAAAVVPVVLLIGGSPETAPSGVVTEPFRAGDWTSSGRSCPSGRSSGGIADTDGTGGEPSVELALARLEERVGWQLPPGLEVARRQVKPGTEKAESLLLTDRGAVGGTLTERFPNGRWQLTGWWSCSP
jgi:hypothetical protein